MILQGLVNYYDRLESTGEVAPPGYSPRPASFALLLQPDGSFDVSDIRDPSAKKPRPRSVIVPAIDRTSGIKSKFLYDNTSYALGRSTKSRRVSEEHESFKDFHIRLFEGQDDDGIQAFLNFLRIWNPERFNTLRYADELLDENVVFKLDGDASYLQDRSAVKTIWSNFLASSSAEKGICLVTGVRAPIKVLHAYIDGIARPGKPRPKLIAIDKDNDAFASYGKEQGANAPVSERAAHAYATALNKLLSKSGGTNPKTKRPKWTNRVQIGDATTLFWAEAAGGLEAAKRANSAECLFATLADPPTDEQEAAKLRALLRSVEQGRPLEEVDPSLEGDTRFYILGLSPNAARLSTRFFLRSTLGEIVAHAAEHYRDLSIDPAAWRTPPSAWWLLRETAVQHEADNVSPFLAGEVARAIFTGGRYPRALLAATLMRIRADGGISYVRADGEISGLRVAIIKACLARAHRKDIEQYSPDPEEDVPMSLDRNETNPGYRLGRLFYVLENAQRMGIGRVNATIRDKFYSSASANPARVFPLLLRGAQDHIGAVRKKSGGGLAYWLDEQIAEIVGGLSASVPFPSTLRLEDQGRFVVGYYHQRYAAKSEGKDAEDLPETDEEE